jgi:hypothetical protein
VQAQGQPQDADCAETKVEAKPKKNRRVKRPAFQLNPTIHQSKKRQSKTNRARSGQAKKPFIRNITPQGSRDCQCENADGRCHHHKQEREKIKAKWAFPEEWTPK